MKKRYPSRSKLSSKKSCPVTVVILIVANADHRSVLFVAASPFCMSYNKIISILLPIRKHIQNL
jgi:hypothetical protein